MSQYFILNTQQILGFFAYCSKHLEPGYLSDSLECVVLHLTPPPTKKMDQDKLIPPTLE